jgi:rSAM/selenodomain-associated transferase 2
VDLPEDLEEGEKALARGATVSVIIPALNEAQHLKKTLEAVSCGNPLEVIVADGGSSDETRSIAMEMGAQFIEGTSGRGAQMNLAAASARGEYLLFLHADTILPEGYSKTILEALGRPDVAAGAFGLGVGGDFGAAGLIENLVDIRCRLFGTPYGDQGFFVYRSLFEKVGGFPEIPVFEDLCILKRIRRLGRVAVVRDRVLSSGRRWQTEGLIRTFLRHQAMLLAHYAGCSPDFVAKFR